VSQSERPPVYEVEYRDLTGVIVHVPVVGMVANWFPPLANPPRVIVTVRQATFATAQLLHATALIVQRPKLLPPHVPALARVPSVVASAAVFSDTPTVLGVPLLFRVDVVVGSGMSPVHLPA
jgi:hypothetical protein